MADSLISLLNVSKDYNGSEAIKDITLHIKRNEFLTMLGPSGCGKTTTLRIIGGFEHPSEGQILFEGIDIDSLPPYKRRVNTVFQKYALFPHMNVYENIAFGLKIKKLEKKVIDRKVGLMLELVALAGYERRAVNSLSGGQQQRVAIARALINEPDVLLLDEPLGALDLQLRKEMQLELKAMQKRLGITFVYITHDQEEALTMSDTVVVMNRGRIQQIGEPEAIYNEPVNSFVAGFIGESNIVEGIMLEDFLVDMAGKLVRCSDKGFARNEAVQVVIRPEDLKIVEPEEGIFSGIVRSATFKGVHYEMIVAADDIQWIIHSTRVRSVGIEVGLRVDPFDIHIMKKVMD
ncbi:spermidine/putrescine transport system ATP-binding protein [Hydrogenispora ethanolica]|jgi:spermidine/putrescine transport system ATP-binding protein|uniref:Spermidine/putrescine import ATP-binding protein PotA n=1 Tax=Hydrogenispora ethanolica TaxID=1082276 RepID=A0A4V2QB98_HYDET|nr:spermidine/putrescine ABC transporter ATP-binding protein [Hydrogenispora ethanolica]TCL55572.1 spermidine/putrescine transport system ATP-binding protein [Hydrogenispora ethanolica]